MEIYQNTQICYERRYMEEDSVISLPESLHIGTKNRPIRELEVATLSERSLKTAGTHIISNLESTPKTVLFISLTGNRFHYKDRNIKGMEHPPPPPPPQTAVTSYMEQISQKIHQLREGISVRPITVCIRNVWDIRKHQTDSTQICTGFLCYDHNGKLLEGWLTGNIQTNDPKYLVEGDIYEFLGFSVINNPRNRKLTQLPYYIRIDQTTIALNVTLDGPVYPVHTLVPQNYRNLLRLATTPTYLPGKSTIVKLILCDNQAADFSILQSKKDRKFKVVIITSIIPKLYQVISNMFQANYYSVHHQQQISTSTNQLITLSISKGKEEIMQNHAAQSDSNSCIIRIFTNRIHSHPHVATISSVRRVHINQFNRNK
ncbi:hypothetical protein YC2023_024357 [Brassica napus]